MEKKFFVLSYVLRDDGRIVLGEAIECQSAANAIIATEWFWRDAPSCIAAVAMKHEIGFDGYETRHELYRVGSLD